MGFGEVGPGSAEWSEHLPAQLSVLPTSLSSSLSVEFVYPVSSCLIFSLPPSPSSHHSPCSGLFLPLVRPSNPHQGWSWLGLRETCPEEDAWALRREPRASGPGSLDPSRVAGRKWKVEVERGRGSLVERSRPVRLWGNAGGGVKHQRPRGCPREAKIGMKSGFGAGRGLVGQVNPAPFPHPNSCCWAGPEPVGTCSFPVPWGCSPSPPSPGTEPRNGGVGRGPFPHTAWACGRP